jgi:hypothetical protein
MTDQQSPGFPELLRAVSAARAAVETARQEAAIPGSSLAVAQQQRLLLATLERYAAVLAQHGRPIPYRLRDELAMYRAMFRIARRM